MKKGFTLIELLIVIAIIAILASIVMVAMSGARNKARDARIKGDISQVRSLAELLYDTDAYSYDNLCVDENNLISSGKGDLGPQFDSLQDDIVSQNATITCHSASTTYCVEVNLQTTGSGYYCVDSTGFTTTTSATTCASGSISCQ